ncbi:hypothetical protein [Armatimonas sp.]|uniref:hypothetical protein n=1 Tax=Armatimonas sp. TaxID=1872638 RepID=UPI00286AB847|nr:hypothetical protein [Armatimonas sp.]
MRRLETRILKFKYMQPMDFTLMLADANYNYTLKTFPAPKPKTPSRSLIPSGVESLSPDNLAQELTVRAEPRAIAEIEALQRLLDVKIRELGITFTVDSSKAATRTFNNAPTLLSVLAQGKAYALQVTPHLNGNNTVSLAISIPTDELTVVNWGDSKQGGGIQADGTIFTFRRVAFGKPISFKWGSATVSLTASPLPV